MTPERSQRLNNVLDKRQPDLTLILENVEDPHNISAVMRTADAVGVQEIFIVTTKVPKHKKWGAKSSSSAAKWLTIHQFTDLEECFGEVRTRFDRVYATHLAKDAVSLFDLDLTQSIALVFGNEHTGVSDEALRLCDGNFIIPQVGIIKSLNISVACAVTLYEAKRQKILAGHYGQRKLRGDAYESLKTSWGFLDGE